jgi:S-adenosylmethionine hydrolase
MDAPVITFLSDYGLEDHFVGVCHGVFTRICPQARVIDITHGIPRHDTRAGALVLVAALPYMPVGVHVAVVDPDVGAARRAIALAIADQRVLVGPDNGLLMPVAERLGGVAEAVEISTSRFRSEPVSATFHGRDIFSPVAARIAAGAPLREAGEPCDPEKLVRLALPSARIDGDSIVAHAVYVDRFGNVGLNIGHEELAGTGLKLGHSVEVSASGAVHEAQYARTFADVGPDELLIYEDADRRLALAVRHGDAARRLALSRDAELRIRPQ